MMIYKKLLAIRTQVSFKKVQKPKLKYKSLDGDATLEMVGNALAHQGIVFIPSMVDAKIDYIEINGKMVQHAHATFELTFVDADTGDTFTAMTQGSGQSYDGKALGIAQTYGIKYFFYRMFLKGESDIDDEAAQTPPTSPPKSTPPPSELDGKRLHKSSDTLARTTFPFADDLKDTTWQDFITALPEWNKSFWPAVRDGLNLDNDSVHTALDVSSVNDWTGGTVRELWLILCSYSLNV